MQTERIYLDGIETGHRLRPLDTERVDALARSISEIGLRTPITVMARRDGPDTKMILVAGHHRLEALRKLQHEATDCIVIDDNEVDAELWEIAENLHRADLTKEQRDQHIRRYAELLEKKEEADKAKIQSAQNAAIEKPSSKRTDGKGHRPEGIASKVAKATGVSKDTVRRALKKTAADYEAEASRKEADRIKRDQNAAIKATAADEFAEWILSQTDLHEIPTIIGWLEVVSPRDVAAALRRASS